MEGSCQPVAPLHCSCTECPWPPLGQGDAGGRVFKAISGLYTSILGQVIKDKSSYFVFAHHIQVLQSTGSMPDPPFIFVGSCRGEGVLFQGPSCTRLLVSLGPSWSHGRAYLRLQDSLVSIIDGPSVISEAITCLETALALWGSLGAIYWLIWFMGTCHFQLGAGT